MNTYIKCPDSKQDEFKEEAKSTVKALYNMVKRFCPENQIKYLKQQMEQQITIQMVKSWHAQNNLQTIIRDCGVNGKLLESENRELKKELKAQKLFFLDWGLDIREESNAKIKQLEQDIENLKRQIR